MAPGGPDESVFSAFGGDADCADLFSGPAELDAMLEVEAALALAEAEAGLFDPGTGERLAKAIREAVVDPDVLRSGTTRDGVPVPALVAELRRQLPSDLAPLVHWGATSQDIIDTALILRLHQCLDLLETRLLKLAGLLAALADRHRQTPMAARTRMQQATPTCFGLKVAGWLSPQLRALERLDALRKDLFVVSFAGASGNLAALGHTAEAVETALARQLGLGVPVTPWHTERDRLLTAGSWFAGLSATLGKTGQDLILLAQSEVGEIRLGSSGGSSTMPNKANPVAAEILVAKARASAADLSTLYQSALQEHERSGTGWPMEWIALPRLAMSAGSALDTACQIFESLEVNAPQMRANIEASNGLMLAEAASFALAGHMPRPEAQSLVKAACAKAMQSGQHLFDVLASETTSDIDWTDLRDPARHLGSADRFIDKVFESYQVFTR